MWLVWVGLALGYAPYVRTPDLHGDRILFSAEEDLWTMELPNGVPRRLTSNENPDWGGYFSPDGQNIAYTSMLDGNPEVYVVGIHGGEPRRLTWHPGTDEVIGWTPSGEVLFRSRRTDPNAMHVFTVSLKGDTPIELPVGWAARMAIEPETGRFAFTRIGRELATWKRYRGGSADDIWVGDPKSADFKEVTGFDGLDSFPMWWGGRIYFISDLGGTANLWSMLPDGADRKQHTRQENWDVRFPNMSDDGRIVYMAAGEVRIFDPKTETSQTISIDLPGERAIARQRYSMEGFSSEWYSLAPNADRLLLTTRGEVFSVPVEEGVTLPVVQSSGSRERYATYLADGERFVYVTDEGGEESIRVRDAWGRGEAKIVVPASEKGWHYDLSPSPNSKWVAWSDDTNTLWIAPLAGGSPKKVDSSGQEEIREYSWSPDGRYLAYAIRDARGFSKVWVYDTTNNEKYAITGENTSDYGPAWDPDGRYLYFLSNRTVQPKIASRDFQSYEDIVTKPYLVLLQRDAENPFADNAGIPPASSNPSEQAKAEKLKKEKKKRDKKEKEKDLDTTEKPLTPVNIDWDGISERVVEFPVSTGSYNRLNATSDTVLWLEDGALYAFDLDSAEADFLADGVWSYDLPLHSDTLAVEGMGGIATMSASGGSPEPVSLWDVQVELDPLQEWAQIYYESWRLQRDFFWDPALGGLDWKAIRDQYAFLLPRLATRGDLNDLIGEMIGELGTSHTYVRGGDFDRLWAPQVSVGLLGAEIEQDGNIARIERIFHGDPADDIPSPLMEPGTYIREGDYILAVNGRPLLSDKPFEANFENLGGRRVILTVNRTPTREGARDVAVTPLYSDAQLRYVDWVRRNREYVALKTDDKMGYLHIPNMGMYGLQRFETWLYPQSDKEGLIVDVRWNGGGFVSQLILEKLRRPILGMDYTRNGGAYRYPQAARGGPFVVLTNEFAGSDGDIFPRAVQLEGLAPVIGERSWGGIIGIRSDKPTVDGGMVTIPEYAFWFREGGWSVENQGVIPDIQVTAFPHDVAKGVDTQLDRAIEEVQKLHQENPPLKPNPEPKPVKTREQFKKKESP